MTKVPSLVELLDQAGSVFTLAGKLGRAFHAEHEEKQIYDAPQGWQTYYETFEDYRNGLKSVEDPMMNPPVGFEQVAERLKDASRLARKIREAVMRNDASADYLEFFPDLNSVSSCGWDEVNAAKKILDEFDPLSIEEGAEKQAQAKPEPAKEPEPEFTLLGNYPVTPEGHVEFLEGVRDDVKRQSEAKNKNLYPEDSIRAAIRGIKWEEARRRLAAIPDLPEDIRNIVAGVLERKLAIGAIEQIDEVLTRVIEMLRDIYGSSD